MREDAGVRMEDRRRWVIRPRHARRFARRFRGQAIRWCYLGHQPRGRARAAAAFPAQSYTDIDDALGRMASDLRHSFVEWIASIGAQQRHPHRWWASRLASHNTLQTDLFLLYGYACVAREWLTQPDEPSIRIAVVEDPWLAIVLRQWTAHSRQAQCAGGDWAGTIPQTAVWCLKAAWTRCYFLLWAAWLWFHTRHGSRETPSTRRQDERATVLLFTWIDDRCFSTTGAFHDSYTGRLEQLLTRRGIAVRRFTPLHVGISRGWLRRLQQKFPRIIVTAQYLRVDDLLAATASWFSIDRLRDRSQFQGMDYAPLLQRELLCEWSSLDFPSHQLWSRAIRRLARAVGWRATAVIYPWENQPWEKVLCWAFQTEAPGSQRIGYQHTIMSPLLLNSTMGRTALTVTPLPDTIIVNGPIGRRLLEEGGFPPRRMADGGTLRFEHLFSPHGSEPATERASWLGPQNGRSNQRIRVIVALPILPQPAQGLIQALLAVGPQLIEEHQPDVLEFIVKPHPLLRKDTWLSLMKTAGAWLTWSDQPLSTWLEFASIFLYVPPSSSAWEAYLKGLTLLRYRDASQAGQLDLDPTAALGDEIPTCTSSTLNASLRTAIRYCQTSPRRDRSARMARLRDIYSPVDESVWTTMTTRAARAEAAPCPASAC